VLREILGLVCIAEHPRHGSDDPVLVRLDEFAKCRLVARAHLFQGHLEVRLRRHRQLGGHHARRAAPHLPGRVPDGAADSFLATHATAQAARLAGAQVFIYHEVVKLLVEGGDGGEPWLDGRWQRRRSDPHLTPRRGDIA
jgi:glycerol-3-phosphate dehydrogenase